jgi:uncharacterized protein (DUF2344 family)
MSKSNDIKKISSLPKVDYSDKELPKDVKEAISEAKYVINESSKLTWDGRQFIVRIPKEIAEEEGLTEQNKMQFRLTKPKPNSSESIKLEIEIV